MRATSASISSWLKRQFLVAAVSAPIAVCGSPGCRLVVPNPPPGGLPRWSATVGTGGGTSRGGTATALNWRLRLCFLFGLVLVLVFCIVVILVVVVLVLIRLGLWFGTAAGCCGGLGAGWPAGGTLFWFLICLRLFEWEPAVPVDRGCDRA